MDTKPCVSQFADLHMHSTYSDGRFSPGQLAALVAQAGLAGFSVTDHEDVRGVLEAAAAAKERGLEFISGIEIKCYLDDEEFELLGYGFDPASADIIKICSEVRQMRENRIPMILAALKKAGVEITLEEVLQEAADGTPGRPHVASALVNKGLAENIREAFELYLGRHQAGYIRRPAQPVQRVLEVIHGAGGAVVLAHPGIIYGVKNVYDLIRRMAGRGIDGLEVWYPYKTTGHGLRDDITSIDGFQRLMSELADELGLIPTGGSDFHEHGGTAGGGEDIAIAKCPLQSLEHLKS